MVVGKTHLPEFAWSVLGAERAVRYLSQSVVSRPDDGRLVQRRGRRPGRRPLRARARYRHGLLHPPALGRVRDRRAQAAVGADADGGRVPALPELDTVGADGAVGRRCGADVVGPHRQAAARAGRGRPDGRPAAPASRHRRRAADGAERRADRGHASSSARRTRRGGARAGPGADTWPLFLHEAAGSHAVRSRRADEYGAVMRTKLEAAGVGADAVAAAYRAVERWRRTSRRSTSTSLPASPSSCRRRRPTSSRSGCR